MNKFDIFNHVAISAGAGSGKTYTLSRRYINILVGFNLFFEGEAHYPPLETLKSARPLEIVTITYTEAGALEMKSRIFSLISSVLAYCDGVLDKKHGDYESIHNAFEALDHDASFVAHIKSALSDALTELSSATISTIHSYCLELIERYGDYLKLDAKPRIIRDDEKVLAYNAAYSAVLKEQSALIKEINDVISLYSLSQIAQKYSFNAQFRAAFDRFAPTCDESEDSLRSRLMVSFLASHQESFKEGFDALERIVTQDPSKSEYCDAILANAQMVLRGHGEWRSYVGQFRKNSKIDEETFDSVKKFRDLIKSMQGNLVDLESEALFNIQLKKVHKLFELIYAKFRATLHRDGYTDFETILQQADMLLNHDIALSTRYFMVDEFQDTNGFQWGIVKKAAAKNSANLFIVGDEKQSIFSFQGSDVSVFAQASSDLGIKPLTMDTNRRSDRSIIAFVNEVFASAMAPQTQARAQLLPSSTNAKIQRCVALFNEIASHKPIESDFEARYESLKTPPKTPEGTIALLATPIDKRDKECQEACDASLQELRHIAAFIHEITQGLHPQYSDVTKAYKKGEKAIAVLFDARKFMLPLKHALLELGLRAKVSDSGNLYATKEINDIFIVLKLLSIMDKLDWDALKAKERYAIVGALRSNIMRLSADAIEDVFKNRLFPQELTRWRELARYLPLDKLIKTIVKESELLHLYRHLEGFEQRSANIEKFIDIAYDYTLRNGSSLSEFAKEIESFIHNEDVKEDEAFVVEEGVGSIEILTMHGSKGLEWSLVIIGGMARSFMGRSKQETLVHDRFENKELVGFKVARYEPFVYRFIKQRMTQKHIAERKRLLYVAMTRPEHHLVLSTTINNYDKGARLCHNCGDKNYFTLINNRLGINLDELYAQKIEQVNNITVHYPSEWQGGEAQDVAIEVVAPAFLPLLAFEAPKIIRPSGESDVLRFLEEERFDAASMGTLVHKIIEKEWRNLDREGLFESYFSAFNVPKEFQANIIKMSKNFLQTPHYEQLRLGTEHYFEYVFVHFVDGQKVKGSIDLFYYDEARKCWVIVDFKTTSTKQSDKESVIKEKGYDRQLAFYEGYLRSVVDANHTIESEICWLNF